MQADLLALTFLDLSNKSRRLLFQDSRAGFMFFPTAFTSSVLEGNNPSDINKLTSFQDIFGKYF